MDGSRESAKLTQRLFTSIAFIGSQLVKLPRDAIRLQVKTIRYKPFQEFLYATTWLMGYYRGKLHGGVSLR